MYVLPEAFAVHLPHPKSDSHRLRKEDPHFDVWACFMHSKRYTLQCSLQNNSLLKFFFTQLWRPLFFTVVLRCCIKTLWKRFHSSTQTQIRQRSLQNSFHQRKNQLSSAKGSERRRKKLWRKSLQSHQSHNALSGALLIVFFSLLLYFSKKIKELISLHYQSLLGWYWRD